MNAKMPKVLIVDDGDRYVELAHALLRDYQYATRCELSEPCWRCRYRQGCTLTHAHDWAETEQTLARHPDLDVVLLDVSFDLPPTRLLLRADGDVERSRRLQGIEILRRLRQTREDLPVVLMTSLQELRYEDAAQALQVDEFVTLAGSDALDARALGLLIERIVARKAVEEDSAGYLWGKTTKMARLRQDTLGLARTSLPMLLLGETGTGKSVLAERVIHPATGRKGPFIAVDLASIPDTLVASELFGTAKGAFSGAVDRAGCFEQAQGGSLFLDEIGNLSQELQRMLLLALQSRRITRLGEGTQRTIDVKLIAATNRDLKRAVREGAFREDLYGRLNPAARFELVPIRERNEDLSDLIAFFIKKTFSRGPDHGLLISYMKAAGLSGPARAGLSIGNANREIDSAVTFVLSRRTFAQFRAHPWPGNVRELESVVANASIFALSDALHAAEHRRAATATAPHTIPIAAKLVGELLQGSLIGSKPETIVAGKGLFVEVRPAANLSSVSRDVERQVLRYLFEQTEGNFREMASRLLQGNPETNERRIRLRFNQLGLRVKRMRSR